jgi:two-component system response regulator YesN
VKAIIIDDEKHVREGLMILAEWDRFGIQTVFEAKDGEEAKAIILEHHPEIIFTDMNMPKIDGIDLLKWLHASEIDSKTIVVSGYDDFQYMRNAITYGSFDYILKPIEPDILNETIERAIKEWKKQALKKESSIENTRVINYVGIICFRVFLLKKQFLLMQGIKFKKNLELILQRYNVQSHYYLSPLLSRRISMMIRI